MSCMGQTTSSLSVKKKTSKVRALGVALGLTIAATGFSAIVGVLIAIPLFVLQLDLESSAVLVSLLIGGQIGFFAVGYLYVRHYAVSIPIERPERRDLGYAIGGAIVALVFATAAGRILTWFGLTPGSVLEEIITQNPIVALWLALLSITVVAPIEEYLFRGVIQGRLRQTFSAPSAIVLASMLFGSLHFGNYVGSLSTVVGWSILIAGVGVIFGSIYERTNTLLVPIIAHALYNTVLFIAGYFAL